MKRILSLLLAAVLAACLCFSVSAEELPSRYDLREEGIVTPVKLQYPWGSCWSFGAVAAAETSILSALAKTWEEFPLDLSELHAAWFAKHPVTEADDPVQAGEGRKLPEGGKMAEQKALSSGELGMVAGLFASGAGPVEENLVPYRGREATPEPWVALRTPEKWLENYQLQNAGKIFLLPDDTPEDERAALELEGYGNFTEEDLKAEAEAELKKKQAEIETGYYLLWYSGDDWSLPATDEQGRSFRMQRSVYLLTDDNLLPPPAVPSDPADEYSTLVPNEAGMNAMKREMLSGRAVVAGYYAEKYSPAGGNPCLFTNYETWAQYTWERRGRNHIICIVGWDDDYPAENFTHEVYVTDADGNRTLDAEKTARTTPPGNGAWLIKNSRGSETDAVPDGMTDPDGKTYPEHSGDYGLLDAQGLHTGYNWISYYDQTLTQAETMTFLVEEAGQQESILQYDYLNTPLSEWYDKQSETPLSAANVFTAPRDLTLTAVSTLTVQENSRVTFRIIRLHENAENPEDGEELAQFRAAFPYAGYHRAALPQTVSLQKGDRFSVITTTDYVSADGKRIWQYAVKEGTGGGDTVVVNPGESFVQENGTWQDWTETEKIWEPDQELAFFIDALHPVYDNFSIKAYFRGE